MKRRTKIISAVMALAILVCVFAVLATSFAVDTSSESASFRVDAQIMGYNRGRGKNICSGRGRGR